MFLRSLRAVFLLTVLSGAVYPALVTLLGQAAFPVSAGGSLVRDDASQVIGSARIGQAFTSPRYLHGRPSAAGEGYDASASSGSNLGLTSLKLSTRRTEEEARLRAENPGAAGPVPEVLLAASASGLDPEIPPEAAHWQLPRIAAARNVDLERVAALLDEQTVGPDLGFLGEARVNVLLFNLALDRRFPVTP